MKRGDVVIVEFPYVDGKQGKNRPALIVQNDRENRLLANTIVAMISGNIRHAGQPSQVLVDPNQPDGASSGYMAHRWSSAATCIRLENGTFSESLDTCRMK